MENRHWIPILENQHWTIENQPLIMETVGGHCKTNNRPVKIIIGKFS